MKRVLLTTTALVAAGLLVTSVAYADEHEMAEEEMMEPTASISMSGYALAIVGFGSNDSAAGMAPVGDVTQPGHVHDTMPVTNPLRGQEVFHVMEFDVAGSITLDNGVTVTGYAQVGSHNADAITETHLTLSGAFGALRIGETESAAFAATVAAPGGGIGMGVNYPWYSPAAAAVNTYSGLGAEDAVKVVYTSPNFNGLTIGMSYAPEASAGNAGTGRTTDDDGQQSEHTALGVSYSTAFMDGGSVSIGMGYEVSTGEGMTAGMPTPDMEAMKFGASVSVDQVSFGGGMYEATPEGRNGSTQYDVGASWAQGPTTVGVQYGANDAGDTGMMALNLTYALGPGVSIGGQVANGSAAGMKDVTQVLLGTQINF